MKRLKSMLNFLKPIKLAWTFKIHLTLKSSWKTVWKSFNNNADPDGVAVFFYFPTMSCSSCLFPHSLHRCVHTRWEWRCIFHIKKKWRLRKIAPMRAEYIYKRVFRLLIDLSRLVMSTGCCWRWTWRKMWLTLPVANSMSIVYLHMYFV